MTKNDNIITDFIDPCYSFPRNTGIYCIASDLFQGCLNITHKNPWILLKHTIIIEFTISKQSTMKKVGKRFPF